MLPFARLSADLRPAAHVRRRVVDPRGTLQIGLRRVEPGDEVPVALAELLACHLLGNDVQARIVQHEAPLAFETLVEGRPRDRLKHSHHRQRDPVVLNEAVLILEDLFVVTVEADDEAGVDVDAGCLDPGELGLERISPHVLKLLRLLERRHPRRLDADEDAAEVRPVEEIEELLVVGQIDARLGRQSERIVILLHPRHDQLEERLGLLLVANEVVIDDEGGVEAGPAEIVELGDQLLRLLHPRLAAVDHDDVAELALEWAPARILHGGRRVAIDFQEVEPRPGDRRHVGRLLLLVAGHRLDAVGDVVEEARPSRLRLADEPHVAQVGKERLVDRDQRPADDRHRGERGEPLEDLPHPILLDDHPRHANDVETGHRLPVDLLDVLVDEDDVVIAAHPGQRRQRARDHRAPLVARVHREGEIEAPIRGLEAGIDEADRKLAAGGNGDRCDPTVSFDHGERIGQRHRHDALLVLRGHSGVLIPAREGRA